MIHWIPTENPMEHPITRFDVCFKMLNRSFDFFFSEGDAFSELNNNHKKNHNNFMQCLNAYISSTLKKTTFFLQKR